MGEGGNSAIVRRGNPGYSAFVLRLTRQEQLVVCVVVALLVVGWGVKAWRTAHPGPVASPGAPEAATSAPAGDSPGRF
jgi:hypothetical protein